DEAVMLDGWRGGFDDASTGRFRFEGVPAGEHEVTGHTSGGLTLHATVHLAEGEHVRVRLALDQPSVKLRGRVTLGGTEPLAATLVLQRTGEDESFQLARSSKDGSYAVDLPGAGSYRLSVKLREGLPSLQAALDVPATPEFVFDLDAPVARIR